MSKSSKEETNNQASFSSAENLVLQIATARGEVAAAQRWLDIKDRLGTADLSSIPEWMTLTSEEKQIVDMVVLLLSDVQENELSHDEILMTLQHFPVFVEKIGLVKLNELFWGLHGYLWELTPKRNWKLLAGRR